MKVAMSRGALATAAIRELDRWVPIHPDRDVTMAKCVVNRFQWIAKVTGERLKYREPRADKWLYCLYKRQLKRSIWPAVLTGQRWQVMVGIARHDGEELFAQVAGAGQRVIPVGAARLRLTGTLARV